MRPIYFVWAKVPPVNLRRRLFVKLMTSTALLAGVPGLAAVASRESVCRSDSKNCVLFRGWVLKRDDLERLGYGPNDS